MAGTIKVNNPIVGGIIFFIVIAVAWVMPFLTTNEPPASSLVFSFMITIVALYAYYNGFMRKKPEIINKS